MSAFRKFMQYHSNVKTKKAALANEKPVGEQTIDQLTGQNQGATNIEIEKADVKGFKKILNKYGVDYAITKDPSQNPPRYTVFFKAKDEAALTAAYKEYAAQQTFNKDRPSVRKALTKLAAMVTPTPKKVREKSQERAL